MPDFLIPFGPFHIVLLHLPIGALAAIWVLELFVHDKDATQKNPAHSWLQILLLITTALTIVLGLAYENLGQYGDEIKAHEEWGLIFGGCVLLSFVLFWIQRATSILATRALYFLSLLAVTITLTIAGHQGGELIHGKGFLTKPFKAEKKKPAVAQLERPAEVEIDDFDLIAPVGPLEKIDAPDAPKQEAAPNTAPEVEADERVALFQAAHIVFERKCFECHGATKQKGKYRLDLKDTIMLPGKSKLDPIVAGHTDDSELFYRMTLERDDDDVMPPEDKDPVSSADIDAVRKWIAAGAYWPSEAEVRAAASNYVETGDADTNELLKQFAETGVKAEYNAWGDNSVRVDLGVVRDGQLQRALKALSAFGPQLTWIDSSNLELPDSFFSDLKQFPNLERLHLDGSNVSDAQLENLADLPKLNYLNLYNTGISDAALPILLQLKNLRKIYLTDTKVSSSTINQLKEDRPELQVVHSAGIPFHRR